MFRKIQGYRASLIKEHPTFTERNSHFEATFSFFGTSLCGGRDFSSFVCFAAVLCVCGFVLRDFAWVGAYADGRIFSEKTTFHTYYAYGNQYFAFSCFVLCRRIFDCGSRPFDEFALCSYVWIIAIWCWRNGPSGFDFIVNHQLDSDWTFGWRTNFIFVVISDFWCWIFSKNFEFFQF